MPHFTFLISLCPPRFRFPISIAHIPDATSVATMTKHKSQSFPSDPVTETSEALADINVPTSAFLQSVARATRRLRWATGRLKGKAVWGDPAPHDFEVFCCSFLPCLSRVLEHYAHFRPLEFGLKVVILLADGPEVMANTICFFRKQIRLAL
jgi:hypothetical protein